MRPSSDFEVGLALAPGAPGSAAMSGPGEFAEDIDLPPRPIWSREQQEALAAASPLLQHVRLGLN